MEKKRMKKAVPLILSFLEWAAATSLWAAAWLHYYNPLVQPWPLGYKGNALIFAVYGLLFLLFNRIYGSYRVGYYKRGDIIFGGFLAAVLTNGITYLQVCLVIRKIVDVRPMLLITLAGMGIIWICKTVSSRVYFKLNPPHRMLVVYSGKTMTESLIYKMTSRAEKYNICEAIHVDEGLGRIFEKIDGYESVILCDIKSETRNKILKYCYSASKRTYLTPKISDVFIRSASEVHLFDTPLLLCRNRGLTAEQRFFKRAMDLAFSGAALLLASPFMLATALAVKLYDRGPILYKQQRLTLGGKVFEVYKFRSMVVDAEKTGGARLASQNDNRITPVGRFIRRTRLDELPQLINIFKGDMSLVGPRPERPEIAAQYEERMPEFSYRLKVKAGLTGYAQILGKYNTTPYDKLKLDLMYIGQYSIFLDIKLILMTIKVVFMPESAEGVKEGQKTADNAEPEKEKV